jgi:hypothetical protein
VTSTTVTASDDAVEERRKKWREYKKARYPVEKEKIKARVRKWTKANKSKVQNGQLLRYYGISLDERNAMFAQQGARCAICKTDKGSSKDFHVDHCHKTGVVRGILCRHCNHVLGHARDNTETLAAAIGYLQRFENG